MKKQNKNTFFSRGGWRMVFCAALLCAVVLSGVLFGAIKPALRIDVTQNGVFTLSDSTHALLEALEKDVYIYIVQDGSQADMRLNEIVSRYDAGSDHIFTGGISAENAAYYTGAQLSGGSLIVTNDENRVIIEYTDLYEMEYEVQGYYRTLKDYSIAAEDRINSAIVHVNAQLPIAYYLSGHGETMPESGFESMLSDAGYHIRSLYLSEIDSVPQDCALIVCNMPQIDITQKEAELLKNYIDNGGSFFLVTDMKYPIGEQLSIVTQHTGLSVDSGIVMERNSAYMFGADYPYYLMPALEVNTAADLSPDSIVSANALIAVAHAIDFTEASGYTLRSLLDTSSDAYIKPDAYVDGEIEYAEGDKTGPFHIAAVSHNDNGGKLFWIGGGQCLSDTIDEMVAGANYGMAKVVIDWMHGDLPVPQSEYVQPRSVMTPRISVDEPALFIGLCAVIPAAILLVGTILCVNRHKRSVPKKEKE